MTIQFENDQEKTFWQDAAKIVLGKETRNAEGAIIEADLLLEALRTRADGTEDEQTT